MADDALFTLPLEDFVAARDTLAREIRKAGDRDTAAVLAKLPKPTPAAWAANQVAREQPELIKALLDAGAALRAAQDAALAGGGAENLRAATQAERRAVDDVMRAAVELKPAGKPLSRAMADRLRTTLHATAGDADLRTTLQAGRLVGEAQAGGAWPFALDTSPDDLADLAAATKRTPKRVAAKRPPATPTADEDEAAAAKQREAEERAERERLALEDELREARGALKVRERVAKGAEEDASDAGDALRQAQALFDQVEQALKDAKDEVRSAERVLKSARKERDQARDAVARLEERLD